MNAEELAHLARILMDLLSLNERLDASGAYYASVAVEDIRGQLAELYREENKP